MSTVAAFKSLLFRQPRIASVSARAMRAGVRYNSSAAASESVSKQTNKLLVLEMQSPLNIKFHQL